MPTVPTKKVSSITTDRLPSVFQTQQVSSEAFGSGLARAQAEAGRVMERTGQQIGQLADNVYSAAIAEKRKENEVDFNEGRLEYDRRSNEMLFGTEQSPGLYSLKGKSAVDGSVETLKKLQELRKEIAGRYTGAVADRLNVSLEDRELNNSKKITSFRTDALNTYQQELSDARKDEYAQDASAQYNDITVIRRSVAGSEVMVQQDAERNGWAPEVVQHKLEETRTHIYKSAIDSAIKRGDTKAARGLFAQFKERIDGPVAADIERSLTVASVLEEAQNVADTIMVTPNATPQDRLAAAREIKDPNVRKEVEAMVKTRNREVAEGYKAQVDAAAKEVSQVIEQGGNIASWAKSNPEKFMHIASDPVKMAQLRRSEEAYAEGRIYANASDGETLLKYRAMDNEALSKLSQDDLLRDRASLTKEEWNSLTTIYGAAQETRNSSSSGAAIYAQGEKALKTFAPKGFGFGETSRTDNTTKSNRRNMANSQMQEFIKNYHDTYGKYPSIPDITAEAKRITLPLSRGGILGFFGIGADYAVELKGMTKEEKSKYTVDMGDVPDAVVQSVKETFRKYGHDKVDDATIEQFLGAEVLGDAERQRKLIGAVNQRSATPRVPSTPTTNPPPVRNTTVSSATPVAVNSTPRSEVQYFNKLAGAVEQVESAGNPNAVSNKGAVGRMQTMPQTLKAPGYGIAPAKDDSDAERTRVGREYLQAMLNKYGSLDTALAAYNWGPGNVDTWLEKGGDKTKLPKETREYLIKVKRELSKKQ